jgi:hypothetical protein
MSEIFAALEGGFTKLYSLYKAGVFVEHARNHFLHQLIGIAPCCAATFVSLASTSGGKLTCMASVPF